ncbi:hypothetical protein BJ684DRAFT_14773 [Piptocephalis cylindrospora]|uniref:Pentatricopeptide repeat domain-containing protein n=1 Tax=Piptocephalis cylindrospora TaxID=1907219 RepID=A0A4P9YA58_9FUNG|nr:hypothetical protein BJ684DRAFT_14773 [Piptocephalis cylindrospora]|eukprot:RKP14940.1 hypothetical protein BJ684DRAFT_14773 [Piptocephalis cylindrospora]
MLRRAFAGLRYPCRALLSTLPSRPGSHLPAAPSQSIAGPHGQVKRQDIERAFDHLSRTVGVLERGILKDFPPVDQPESQKHGVNAWYSRLSPIATPGFLALLPQTPLHKDEDAKELAVSDLRRRIQALRVLQHELTQPSSKYLFQAYQDVTSLHRGSSLLSPYVYVIMRRRILVGGIDKWTYQRLSQTYRDQRQAWGLSLLDATKWADALVRISDFSLAESILAELKNKGYPLGKVGWTALIHSQTLLGEMSAASSSINAMIQEGDTTGAPLKLDSFLYSYLIIGYLRIGNIVAAKKLCEQMFYELRDTPAITAGVGRSRGRLSAQPCNAIIFELISKECYQMAMDLYSWMQEKKDEGGRRRFRQFYRSVVLELSPKTQANTISNELFHVRSIEGFVAIWDAKGAWVSINRMIRAGWIPRARIPLLVLPLLLHPQCASCINDKRAQSIVDWVAQWKSSSWKLARGILDSRGGTSLSQEMNEDWEDHGVALAQEMKNIRQAHRIALNQEMKDSSEDHELALDQEMRDGQENHRASSPLRENLEVQEKIKNHQGAMGPSKDKDDWLALLQAHYKASEGELALRVWMEMREKGWVRPEETELAQKVILACLKNMTRAQREREGRVEGVANTLVWRKGLAQACYRIWEEGVEAGGQWGRTQVSVLLQIMRMSQMPDEIVSISRWAQYGDGKGIGPTEENWTRRALYREGR